MSYEINYVYYLKIVYSLKISPKISSFNGTHDDCTIESECRIFRQVNKYLYPTKSSMLVSFAPTEKSASSVAQSAGIIYVFSRVLRGTQSRWIYVVQINVFKGCRRDTFIVGEIIAVVVL